MNRPSAAFSIMHLVVAAALTARPEHSRNFNVGLSRGPGGSPFAFRFAKPQSAPRPHAGAWRGDGVKPERITRQMDGPARRAARAAEARDRLAGMTIANGGTPV